MPDTITGFIESHLQERADHQTEFLCTGTGLFVLHKDLKTVQSAPQDPYAVAAGLASGDGKCVLVTNTSRLPWLEIYPLVLGDTAAGALPDTVWVHGRVPYDRKSQDPSSRLLPFDLDAAYPEPVPLGSQDANKNPGYFVPLKEQGASAPSSLDFNTGAEVLQDATNFATRFRIYTPKYVYVAGVRDILVTIDTNALTTADAGMFLGRFSF